jgi:hypothetical protein
MKLDVQEMDRTIKTTIVLVLIDIALAVFVVYFFGRLLSGR